MRVLAGWGATVVGREAVPLFIHHESLQGADAGNGSNTDWTN